MRQNQGKRGTPSIAALARSLALLEAVLADREGRSADAIAADVGVPRATAHRQVATLIREGYVRRLTNGRLVADQRLLTLAQSVGSTQVIVASAAPALRNLAKELGCVAQLGTFENDMVTYRFKAGAEAGSLFTRVGLQLEAYCTAIGKVLLAHLSDIEIDDYLTACSFPRLTENTIATSEELRVELTNIRKNGWARDNEEMVDGLVCFAVPIGAETGHVIAAISVSTTQDMGSRINESTAIDRLRRSAREIEVVLSGVGVAGVAGLGN